jgi:plasmid stabilization system protein ParE
LPSWANKIAHRLAPRAEADLDDIWLYVARESASMEVATRLIDSITGRFSFLAAFPYVGRARDEDFGAGSRSFSWANSSLSIASRERTFSFSGWHTAGAILKRCSIGDHEARAS